MVNRASIKRIIVFLVTLSCYCIAYSQKSISMLLHDLEKSNTLNEKVNICFEVSRKYADALKIDSGLYYANRIKELGQKDNLGSALGKYHLALSIAQFYRGASEETKKNALESIRYFEKDKDTFFLGIAWYQLGIAEEKERNATSSRKYLGKSADYLKLIGNDRELYRPYFWLARSFERTSDYDSAAHYYFRALTIAEALKDSARICMVSASLGDAFMNLYDLEKAAQYIVYGLNHRVKTSDRVGIWLNIGDYASCLSRLHQFEKADSVIKEFERLANQYNHTWGWIVLEKLKGIQQYEMGNYQAAHTHLDLAYRKELLEPINVTQMRDIMLYLGRAAFKLRQYDSAVVYLKQGNQIALSLKDLINALEADYLISQSYELLGNPDSTLLYFRRYASLKESVLSLEKQKMLAEVTTKYETQKKEQEIKMLQKEGEATGLLLQVKNQQLEKQKLEAEKRSQQLSLVSQQNEINKLDASEKALSLDNERKENEKNQAKMHLMERETAFQKLFATKQSEKKRWAYIAIALILVISTYTYYRARQNKQLSNQLSASLRELKLAQEQLVKAEKEKEAENLRVKISQDIHDEVGATLSGVALFSEIAKEKMQQQRTQDAQEYLEHISTNSKEMVNKISDIVWAINPENDSFERIIEKLRAYAVNLCAGKKIMLQTNMDEALRNCHPMMEVKRNLYLFIKEGINNAIKYSQGKNIILSVRLENDSLITEIKDDGNGFDSSRAYSGNGLNNMRARAASLNGSLEINSNKGVGTIVRLRFDFHPIGGYAAPV